MAVSAELWSRFIPTYVIVTLLVAACVWKQQAMGHSMGLTEMCTILAASSPNLAANVVCNLTMTTNLIPKALSAMGVGCKWLEVVVSAVLAGSSFIFMYKCRVITKYVSESSQDLVVSLPVSGPLSVCVMCVCLACRAPHYWLFAYLLPGAYDGYFDAESAGQRATDVLV